MSLLDEDNPSLRCDVIEEDLKAEEEFLPDGDKKFKVVLYSKESVEKEIEEIDIKIGKKFIPGKVFYPLDIRSALTKKQQAICVKILQMYRSEHDFNKLTPLDKQDLEVYKKLQKTIHKENLKFAEYVKNDWKTRSGRVENMNQNLFHYAQMWWSSKLEKVTNYTSLYQLHDTVPLTFDDPDNQLKVCFQKTILNIGKIHTAIFPTLLSKYILDYPELEKVKCMIENSQQPVSMDNNIAHILKTLNVDVVISMSAIKRIMDNSDPQSFWNIPVIVKEQKIKLPDGTELTKKVVLVDKVLPLQFPTKHDLNTHCHKILIRDNLCQIFTDRDFEVNNDEDDEEVNVKEDQNIIYNVWEINFKDEYNILMKTKKMNKKISCLIRQKIDGFEDLSNGNKRPVVFVPKIEYQLEYGANICTKSELLRQWADLFYRPYSHLYRVRLQGGTSEVVSLENVSLDKINMEAMQHHKCKPHERLGAIFTVFSKLTELECGNYMLHHNTKIQNFAEVLKECSNMEQVHLDLSKSYDPTNCSVQPNKNRSWCPIDLNYILPVHTAFKRMPGMFKPSLLIRHGGKKKRQRKQAKAKKAVQELK